MVEDNAPTVANKPEANETSEPESEGRKGATDSTNVAALEWEALDHERLRGWRLYGTTLSANLCVFLANLEVSIVSTSLVAITDDLRSFSRSSWIITSYLLTYTGFLIVWAKFSDALGRRQCLCTALVIFIIASGACGGAQTIDQLIIFRAFQGIGGSGLLAIPYVILPEMVEPQRYALWASFTSLALVFGYLLGPILGGAIVGGTTWRWVFLLNLPLGAVTLLLLIVFIPVGFPAIKSNKRITHLGKLKEIDYLGATLVFAISAFIVCAIEEAGTIYAWSSALVIVLLVLAGLCIPIFLAWEHFVDNNMKTRQAVFTWRLMKNRVFMGVLLVVFLAGAPFTVLVIQIPQQWQTVSNTTALVAGVRLLPFTLCFTVGIILAMMLTSKLHIPLVFVLFLGAMLQIVGMAITSSIPLRTGAGRYGSEVLMSIGLGANIGVLVQATPQLIRGKDQAAAMGAISQFRALGGVIGISIATNVFNSYIRSHLSTVLTPGQITELLQSVEKNIASLPPDIESFVRSTFASAYDLQTKAMIAFAVAQVLAIALMWEKDFRRLI